MAIGNYKASTNSDPTKAVYGESSQGVGALQAQLNQKYAGQAGFVPLKVDNKFGPLTQAAMNFKPTTTANKNTPIGQISTVGMDNGNDYYGSIMEKQARGEDIVDTGRIRSDILSRFQDRINATNDIYNRQLAAARQEGVGRVGSGTSLLAARGLTGSMRGGAIKENILDQNRQIEGAIDAERNAAIQNILGMAEQSAIEEAARRREAIQSGASNYINYVKSQGETKRANLENVAGQLIVQGIDPAQLDANYISKLAKDIGVSTNDIMSAYKTAQYKASQGEGFELSEGQARYDAQGNLIAERGKTYKTGTGGDGSGGGAGAGGIYDTLDYRTANAVIAQGNQFGTSDVVKKYNNIVAASNLIRGVDPSTQNPAEHQAIVYNFAKALDPDSVVREGEYATVKKYSQNLLNRYGGEIKQAIKGTGFLSPGAILAIQEATDNRIKAYEPQYKNLKAQTKTRINKLAGKDVADQVLLDYEQGYTGNQGTTVIAPDGTEVIITD